MPAPNQAYYEANLLGSVNPNGLDTHWWFAYGTTPRFGATTASVDAGSGTTGVTVTATVTNLTAGQTYYFALVGQSAAGTVYGNTQTFVPTTTNPVVTPGQIPSPSSVVPITTPHLAWPFNMTNTGANVVEQNTGVEIFACIQAIANTPRGQIPELPNFGIPDLTFTQAPPDVVGLATAIQQQEPRATENGIASALDASGSSWQIALTPQTS